MLYQSSISHRTKMKLLSIVVVAWAVIGSAYGRLSNYSN